MLSLLALVALAGPALGQASVVDLAITLEPATVEVDPGQERTVDVVLENDGSQSGTASLSVLNVASGWAAELSQTEVTVPAGGTTTVELALTAPATRENANDQVGPEVEGTIADASGQFTATDRAELQAALTPPPPPPPEPFPWVEVVGASAGGLAIVAAGTAGWFLRRRETGIEIDVASGESVRPGGEAYVPVRVANRSKRTRLADVQVVDVPPGWGASVNRNQIPLDPGEEENLWLSVKPPSDAAERVHEVALSARPAEARWSSVEVSSEIQVLDTAADPDNPSRTLIAPIGVPSPDPYEDQEVLGDDDRV